MIVACIILAVLGLIGLIGFFVWKKDTDKWSKLYVIIAVLIMAASGFLGVFVSSNPNFWFAIGVLIWLALGVIHTWLMYLQVWSIRNPYNIEEDSFWPELLYTIFIGLLGSSAFLGLFGWLNPEWSVIFLMITVAFPLSYLGLKTYDLARQISLPNFEIKWLFPPERFDPSGITQANKRITFQLAKSRIDEDNFFSKKANIWLELPDDISLGNAFSIAIEQAELYIRDNPDRDQEQIKDFGYENGGQEHWWLFYTKWILWRPASWFRKIKYLDPDATLNQNMLKHEDVVVAKRMVY